MSDNIYERICPPADYFVQEWTDKSHRLACDDVKSSPKFPGVWDQKIIPFIERAFLCLRSGRQIKEYGKSSY